MGIQQVPWASSHLALLKPIKIIRPAKPPTHVVELHLPDFPRLYEIQIPLTVYDEFRTVPDAVTAHLWGALAAKGIAGVEFLDLLDTTFPPRYQRVEHYGTTTLYVIFTFGQINPQDVIPIRVPIDQAPFIKIP